MGLLKAALQQHVAASERASVKSKIGDVDVDVPLGCFVTLAEVPALIIIGLWAVLQFLNVSLLGGGELRGGGVAYAAHAGGFMVGMAIILMLGGQRLLYKRRARQSTGYGDDW